MQPGALHPDATLAHYGLNPHTPKVRQGAKTVDRSRSLFPALEMNQGGFLGAPTLNSFGVG